MKKLKMWGHRGSSCCQKVLWTAAEAGLTVELTKTGGGYGGLGEPAFLAMNPNRVVPVIDDDGFVMWESGAILCYIAATYGRGTLHPEDPRALGDAYRWIFWQDSTLRPRLLGIHHSWKVVTEPLHRHLDELETTRKGLAGTWAILENALADRPYLAGDAFSMADIPAGIMAHWWYDMPIDHMHLPNIRAWYDRLLQRPAFREHVADVTEI